MTSEMTVERRLTIQGALDRATAALAAAGLREPRREAVRIFADLLGATPGEILLERGAVIEPDRRRWVERAVARRAAGEPLAYVTGLAGFRRLVLRSDRRGLIPRPETEGIIDRALRMVSGGIAVDVGTGTGCLALALRDEGSYATVLGIDRSPEALALAGQNRRFLGLEVGLVRGDLLAAIGGTAVDLVIANPPYLTEAEYLALDSSVRDHEPRVALVSGPTGLEVTATLFAEARAVVRPGGAVVVEIAADRPGESAAAARDLGWNDVTVENDLFGRPRYLTGRREAT